MNSNLALKIPGFRQTSFRQAVYGVIGGLTWGTVFCVTPLDLLFITSLVWIPLLLWLEYRRLRAFGIWPGATFRYAVIIGVVALAANAPFKFEDKRVMLPAAEVTLEQLEGAGVIVGARGLDEIPIRRVVLPSKSPTRRELMEAISSQVGAKTTYMRCGNGSTILFGSGTGPIRVFFEGTTDSNK